MRSQPHRIVLGEVRGTEAINLIEACNTGHAGTICTVHSNGGRAALRRLHLLARRAVPGYLIEEIEEAVDAVVQLAIEDGRRRVTEIWRGAGGWAGPVGRPVAPRLRRGGAGRRAAGGGSAPSALRVSRRGRWAARPRVRTVRQETAPAS